MSDYLTSIYHSAKKAAAPQRRASLEYARGKAAARLLAAEPNSEAAQKAQERIDALDAALALINEHGFEKKSDAPVGVLASAPPIGG